MPHKHKHKRNSPTREEVISIGQRKYGSGGFVNPTMAEIPVKITRPDAISDLLKTLPQLSTVKPPMDH